MPPAHWAFEQIAVVELDVNPRRDEAGLPAESIRLRPRALRTGSLLALPVWWLWEEQPEVASSDNLEAR